MSRQTPYPEALQRLSNSDKARLDGWFAFIAGYENDPHGDRQAFINRLIELQKDTTSREAEAFKGLRTQGA